MIKRIIFDIDNTILASDKDCDNAYHEYFKKEGLKDFSKEFYDIIEEYDSLNRSYELEDVIKFVQSKNLFPFSKQVFVDIFKIYSNHATLIEKDLSNTLEILSKKYELVCLTNWYYLQQCARLKKAGILKYFKDVYGIDNAGIKPDLQVYKIACGKHKLSECLMVGDSLEKDVIKPIEYGMKAIYYNPSNKKVDYKSINKLKELIKGVE